MQDHPSSPEHASRLAQRAWLMLLIGLAIVAVLWVVQRPGPQTPPREVRWAPLLEAIGEGDANAAAQLRWLAHEDWPSVRWHLPAMERNDAPPTRALAVSLAAKHEPRAHAALFLRRASDADARVRAAAFAGLQALAPLPGDMPLRDTPLHEREALLLRWAQDSAAPVGPSLCAAHALPGHTQFGEVLMQLCMQCHVGPDTAAAQSNASCANCHADIAAVHARTAHANTMTHLAAVTIDPATRQPARWLDLRPEPRGLDCAACHLPASEHQGLDCPVPQRSVVADNCSNCHGETAQQWQQWQAQPRRIPAQWPPGDLALDTGPAASCIDCHAEPGDTPADRHAFAVRRDEAMLASAAHVALHWPSSRQVRLTLTNLAGHALPTGLERRAVDLRVWFDFGQGMSTPASTLARFIASTDQANAGLPPGSSRTFTIEPPPDAQHLHWSLVYVRNRHEPNTYTLPFSHGVAPIPNR